MRGSEHSLVLRKRVRAVHRVIAYCLYLFVVASSSLLSFNGEHDSEVAHPQFPPRAA